VNAEIVAIGTEILLGHIVNTNASYISQKLAQIGIDVYYHSTVGDNPLRLSQTIKTAMNRSDVVITTGGLGPTVDDITVETIANLMGKKRALDRQVLRKIRSFFRQRHITMPASNVNQGYIPEGARVIQNNAGTAPGLMCWHDGRVLIALPGVPREMVPMMEDSVIPYLKKINPSKQIIKSRTIKVVGLGESAVNDRVKDILRMGPIVTVGIYAHPAQIDLRITAKAKNEKQADELILQAEKKIRRRLKDYVLGADSDTLESIVGNLLSRQRKTVSTAESCTGGFIANRITNVPGSSKYFRMGIVVYSNDSKTSKLNIPSDIIKQHGAVSKQVALLMASNIRTVANTDFGIGVTGIAGPTGATAGKPVGLVYIALSSSKGTRLEKCNFPGEREIVKFRASQLALDMLRKELHHG
jgi:nicotinamide-nucleotide amidase